MKWVLAPFTLFQNSLKTIIYQWKTLIFGKTNEAFAVQVVYCRDKLGIPMEKLNLDGGSISIGHPYGMTGSRQVGHLAEQLQNQEKTIWCCHDVYRRWHGASGLFERYPS